jgi:alpha-mannosidase
MAFKPSEDNPEKFILRFYECHGKIADLSLESDFLTLGEQLDLLENNITSSPINQENLKIQPWKIATFAVSVK